MKVKVSRYVSNREPSSSQFLLYSSTIYQSLIMVATTQRVSQKSPLLKALKSSMYYAKLINAYHNSFHYLDLWNQPIREIFQAMRPLSLLIPITYIKNTACK